jgi:quinol monooxygenase YgiN
VKPTVAAVAKITAQPGKRDELVAAFQPLIEAVAAEEGTLLYVLHVSHHDDDTVWFYEQYTDNDALAAHSSSPAMKAIGPELAGLLAGRPEITLLTPMAGKGL